MHEIFDGLGIMAMVSVIAMLIVIVAMAVDLVSGVRKAKIRGEARTSYGFSRTLTKFLVYEGILIVAVCIDALLHFGLWQFGAGNYVVPCTEVIMAVVLCGVEMWSVQEKAEAKERRRMAKLAEKGAALLDKESLRGILADVLREYLVKRDNNEVSIIEENVNLE